MIAYCSISTSTVISRMPQNWDGLGRDIGWLLYSITGQLSILGKWISQPVRVPP